MTTFDYKAIDLDAIINSQSTGSYTVDGTRAFYTVKMDTSFVVYFMSNPWDGEKYDWAGWREVFARDGFMGDIEPPIGHRAIPVNDSNGPEGDPLLALVKPYVTQYNDTPTRPVTTVVGVNVVEITKSADGKERQNHRILVMNQNRIRKLMNNINSARDLNEDFSLVGTCWQLSFSGKGFQEVVGLRRVKEMPPIDLPEMFNIPDLVQQRYDIVKDHIQQHSGVDLDVLPAPEVLSFESDAEPVQANNLYESMTDARLKNLLAKAGISVNPKASRAELVELATTSL